MEQLSIKGKFIISLDYEMMWGIHDKRTPAEYMENIKNTRLAIESMIQLFYENNIEVTFGTVGALIDPELSEMKLKTIQSKPTYFDTKLSPYNEKIYEYLQSPEKIYFRDTETIKNLLEYKNFEIASHTYSHYYCLEPGQSVDQFRADLEQVRKVGNHYRTEYKSFIFPRNQYSEDYLDVLVESGYIAYRGNEVSSAYQPTKGADQRPWRRLFRLMDSYINLSGHNTSKPARYKSTNLINIPSSRFLRPYSKILQYFDGLRLRRIKRSMTVAAIEGSCFHLWWHPHNFGKDLEENIAFLKLIVDHYKVLNSAYGFRSCTMYKVASEYLKQNK